MSENRPHIIKKQVVELRVSDASLAAQLQELAGALCREKLLPVIDAECSAIDHPQGHRFERLEVDLGVLSTDHFLAEMEQRFPEALRTALHEAMEVQDHTITLEQDIPQPASHLELVAFYLRNGMLPWWADKPSMQSLREALDALIRAKSEGLRRLLVELVPSSASLERLVRDFLPAQLMRLAGLLVPSSEAFLTAYAAAMQRGRAGIAASLQTTDRAFSQAHFAAVFQTLYWARFEKRAHAEFVQNVWISTAQQLAQPANTLVAAIESEVIEKQRNDAAKSEHWQAMRTAANHIRAKAAKTENSAARKAKQQSTEKPAAASSATATQSSSSGAAGLQKRIDALHELAESAATTTAFEAWLSEAKTALVQLVSHRAVAKLLRSNAGANPLEKATNAELQAQLKEVENLLSSTKPNGQSAARQRQAEKLAKALTALGAHPALKNAVAGATAQSRSAGQVAANAAPKRPQGDLRQLIRELKRIVSTQPTAASLTDWLQRAMQVLRKLAEHPLMANVRPELLSMQRNLDARLNQSDAATQPAVASQDSLNLKAATELSEWQHELLLLKGKLRNLVPLATNPMDAAARWRQLFDMQAALLALAAGELAAVQSLNEAIENQLVKAVTADQAPLGANATLMQLLAATTLRQQGTGLALSLPVLLGVLLRSSQQLRHETAGFQLAASDADAQPLAEAVHELEQLVQHIFADAGIQNALTQHAFLQQSDAEAQERELRPSPQPTRDLGESKEIRKEAELSAQEPASAAASHQQSAGEAEKNKAPAEAENPIAAQFLLPTLPPAIQQQLDTWQTKAEALEAQLLAIGSANREEELTAAAEAFVPRIRLLRAWLRQLAPQAQHGAAAPTLWNALEQGWQALRQTLNELPDATMPAYQRTAVLNTISSYQQFVQAQAGAYWYVGHKPAVEEVAAKSQPAQPKSEFGAAESTAADGDHKGLRPASTAGLVGGQSGVEARASSSQPSEQVANNPLAQAKSTPQADAQAPTKLGTESNTSDKATESTVAKGNAAVDVSQADASFQAPPESLSQADSAASERFEQTSSAEEEATQNQSSDKSSTAAPSQTEGAHPPATDQDGMHAAAENQSDASKSSQQGAAQAAATSSADAETASTDVASTEPAQLLPDSKRQDPVWVALRTETLRTLERATELLGNIASNELEAVLKLLNAYLQAFHQQLADAPYGPKPQWSNDVRKIAAMVQPFRTGRLTNQGEPLPAAVAEALAELAVPLNALIEQLQRIEAYRPARKRSNPNSPQALQKKLGNLLKKLEAEAKRVQAAIGQALDVPRTVNTQFSDSDEIYVGNAGMVLVYPFLPRFFKKLGLLEEGQWQSDEAQARAVLLLQAMVGTPVDEVAEFQLPLNKLICGLEPNAPIPLDMELTEEERNEAEGLLMAVIMNVPLMKKLTVEGLRRAYLQREGVLSRLEENWKLVVQRETYDVVIDRVPWSFNTLKLPWTETVLFVEW